MSGTGRLPAFLERPALADVHEFNTQALAAGTVPALKNLFSGCVAPTPRLRYPVPSDEALPDGVARTVTAVPFATACAMATRQDSRTWTITAARCSFQQLGENPQAVGQRMFISVNDVRRNRLNLVQHVSLSPVEERADRFGMRPPVHSRKVDGDVSPCCVRLPPPPVRRVLRPVRLQPNPVHDRRLSGLAPPPQSVPSDRT